MDAEMNAVLPDELAPDAALSGMGANPVEPAVDAAAMVEPRSPEAMTMVDERECLLCGRRFDAFAPGARCESRPFTCSACCPHPYCHERSPFVAHA